MVLRMPLVDEGGEEGASMSGRPALIALAKPRKPALALVR